MYKFGKQSKKNLLTCNLLLQDLFNEVILTFDCSILCGQRNQEDQDKAYRSGFSRVKFPDSAHNKTPSWAVDVAPWPIDWKDLERFYFFGGFVLGLAKSMDISLRYGGDWNGNMDIKDENFLDLVHFELI